MKTQISNSKAVNSVANAKGANFDKRQKPDFFYDEEYGMEGQYFYDAGKSCYVKRKKGWLTNA